MSRSKVVAILIWFLVLAATLLPPPRPPHPSLPALPKLLLLFPVVFFTVASFFGGYPFSGGRFRTWLDKTWGEGTYIEFIRDLKPMLLWGVVALAGAAACSLHTCREGAPIDAYWACGFSLSVGVGFLLARLVLAKRGLLMESRSPSAWRAQSASSGASKFLPASIRRLRATNVTAALAGAGMLAGSNAVTAFASYCCNPSLPTLQNVQFAALAFFFFLLVPIFVAGFQHPDRHSVREIGKAAVRGLCWMLGAAAFGVIYDLLKGLLFRFS